VQFLTALGQIVFALFISGAVAVFVGPTYVAVAILVTMTSVVLLYEAARRHVIDEPLDIQELLLITGSSIVFGVIWPSIPLILTLRKSAGEPAVDE
jgi:hypothetical protein